jgi:type II secretory pathway pseudopilin PulG
MKTRLVSQQGFGIIESLVAMGIIAMGMLGAVTIMQTMQGGKNKTLAVGLAAEETLIAATQNYDLMKTYGTSFSAGVIPPVSVQDATGLVIANSQAPVYLGPRGTTCTGYPSETCTVKVTMDVKKINVVESVFPDYRVAYRVEFAQTGKSVASRLLGAPLPASGNAFAASDYSLSINYTSYERSTNVTDLKCAGGSGFLVTGFNRDTGKVSCAKKPTSDIGVGNIATLVSVDVPSRTFTLDPGKLALRKLSCPANYALEYYTPANLDPRAGSTTAAGCIFVGQASVPWRQTATGLHGVTGTFCPGHYKTSSVTCTATVVASNSATCSVPTGYSTSAHAITYTDTTVSPNANGYSLQTQSGVDQTASCYAAYSAQPCGSSIAVKVTMSGRCDLSDPLRVPASFDSSTTTTPGLGPITGGLGGGMAGMGGGGL